MRSVAEVSMICALEIVLLIAGIVLLVRGRFQLSRRRFVEGLAARLTGVLLILPLPLAFVVGFIIGLAGATSDTRFHEKNFALTLSLVELGLVLLCCVLAMAMALLLSQPNELDDEDAHWKRRRRDLERRRWRDLDEAIPVQSPRRTEARDLDEADPVVKHPPRRDEGRMQPGLSASTPPSFSLGERELGRRSRRRQADDNAVASTGGLSIALWVAGGVVLLLCLAGAGVTAMVAYFYALPAASGPAAARPNANIPNNGLPPPVKGDKVIDKGDKLLDKAGKPLDKDEPLAPVELPPLPAPVLIQSTKLAEATSYRLPGDVKAVAVGGGGRYLVLHLRAIRKLAVFDVNEAKVTKYIPLSDDNARFAAGMTKLLIYVPKNKLMERWNLLKLEKEHQAAFQGPAKIYSFCMGCASDGPLLVSSDGSPGTEFYDISDFSRLPIPLAKSGIHAPAAFWPAANGRAFGSCGLGGGMPNGVASLVLEAGQAKFMREHIGTWFVACGPDGKHLYPAGYGVRTIYLQPSPDVPALAKKGSGQGSSIFVPAHHGPFYLHLHVDLGGAVGAKDQDERTRGATVYMLGVPKAIARLRDIGLATFDAMPAVREVGIENTIHLIPRANLVVVIPPSLDRLLLHPVDLARGLEETGLDYVLVTSTPPATFVPGQAFQYQVEVKTKAGKATFVLEAAPAGMTVSKEGRLVWQPPANFTPKSVDVSIRVRGTPAQETFHTFTLMAALAKK
jgi:hypothetical protein